MSTTDGKYQSVVQFTEIHKLIQNLKYIKACNFERGDTRFTGQNHILLTVEENDPSLPQINPESQVSFIMSRNNPLTYGQ